MTRRWRPAGEWSVRLRRRAEPGAAPATSADATAHRGQHPPCAHEHAAAGTARSGGLVSGDTPGRHPGPAHAVIRADEISLSTAEPSMSSVQNQFRGKIKEIVPVGALTRITVDAAGTPIVAAVTARSVRELQLFTGVDVVVGFKATAVHLC